MGDTCHHYKGDMWHGMTSTADWVGMVVGYVADWWTNQHLMRGGLLLVLEVPCGPVMGCHVAPCDWLLWFMHNVMVSTRVEPPTYSLGNRLEGPG
jgi:hypothetical protein